jgi:CheY-like chemotaxis protein
VNNIKDQLMPMTKNYRVLLVDDDEISRTLAETMLIEHGFTVFSFESGQSAIKQLENGLICEIIVLDLLMPGMDGFSTATYIRNNLPQFDHVPLLALSSDSGPQRVEANSRHLFDGRLTKPYDNTLFLHTLAELLGIAPPHISSDAPGVPRSIDFAQGLMHFSSLSKAYEHVLSRFSQYQEHFLSAFGTSLANMDLDDCRRLAHGLKGSLRMIGASEAGDCAGTLEQACSSHEEVNQIEERLKTMQTLLRTIDREIRIKLLTKSA